MTVAIKAHPMAALKGTPEGKALMDQVRAHRGGNAPSGPTPAKEAPVAPPRNLDAASRRKLAATGVARPDGSYPIGNQADLDNAVKDWVRTGRSLAVKSWIQKRAGALKLELPESMESPKQTDELDVGKAIAARRGN